MKDRLNEIRRRVEKATPGPWAASPPNGSRVVSYSARHLVSCGSNWQDVDFITHAREDVPWLLAELDRARAGINVTHDGTNMQQERKVECPDCEAFLWRPDDGSSIFSEPDCICLNCSCRFSIEFWEVYEPDSGYACSSWRVEKLGTL